jgi:hypothetical protein
MTELEQAIKTLDRNLRLLIKKNKRLEQELSKLREENKKMVDSHTLISASLEQINLQNSILKSSQQKLDPEEKKAAEKQIQQFIQEIERCISFLSR